MGRRRPSFLSDSGTKMQDVERALGGGHIIIKKDEALIAMAAVLHKATECPAAGR